MASNKPRDKNTWSDEEMRKQEWLYVSILTVWFVTCGSVGYFTDPKIGLLAAPPGIMFSLSITRMIRDWKSGLGWWHLITTLVAVALTVPFVAIYFGLIG